MLPCSIGAVNPCAEEKLAVPWSGTPVAARRSDLSARSRGKPAMRSPSTPGNNGAPRPRGAIRTHLGRKRVGARGRRPGYGTRPGELDRREQEDLFDRLMGRFQSLFEEAGERTASAFDSALDRACDTLVAAGEFTADNAERLRQYLRRDLLH